MFQLRKMVAVCSLSLAALLALAAVGRLGQGWPAVVGAALLLCIGAWGVAKERQWAPWLALGVAIASMPLLCVLALAPATLGGSSSLLHLDGEPLVGEVAGVAVAPAILAGLALLVVGATAGSVGPRRTTGGRVANLDARSLRLLGFAFTLGAACLGGIVLLASANWVLHGPSALLHGRGLADVLTAAMLAVSLGLLAVRRSAGLLVLAAAMLPMTAIGVGLASRSIGAGSSWGLVFALVCFVPALVSGGMCLSHFVAPMWALLRGR